MLLLHTETDESGRLFFRAERHTAEGKAAHPLAGEELLTALAEVVWYPEGFLPTAMAHPDRAYPTWNNLLMFLSDVRGRRFRRGIFLAADVFARVDEFRTAARLVAAGRCLPGIEERPDGFAAVWRVPGERPPFLRQCADALARRAGRTVLETGGRHETAEDAWLAALRSDDPRLDYGNVAEMRDLVRRLDDWRAPLAVSAKDRAALRFALVPPATADGAWRLDYSPPVTRMGLVSLGQAIRLFPPLAAEAFRKEHAEAFLRTGAALLASAGFSVDVPEGILGEHVCAEADMLTASAPPASGRISLAAKAVTAKLTIRVDGEVVDEQEIAFLLAQNSPIVFFRNRWIEVDRAVLKEALRAIRATQGRRLATKEALSWLFGTRRLHTLRITQARAHGWLRGLINELKGGEGFRVLPPPEGLKGELRPYQLRGYSWLDFLCRLGFGPCLADEMGLGKTVQTIAWTLGLRARRKEAGMGGPVLVVAPVSVTTNWVREFRRFAPGLKVLFHQGGERAHGGSFAVRCRRVDVVVTGYALLVKDLRDFRDATFAALVLDEAQVIKNPDTRVARAVRALDVPRRVALTGTPLENSVRDLWSIEEFLNPGLLGDRRDFVATYGRDLAPSAAVPVATATATRLRHVLEPFMLRRLKSDPGVAGELGDKREIREYCALSPEQRTAYEEACRRFRDETGDADDGRGRHGRMLALLTELKQICDGEGKLARLDDLLEEMFAAGESALIFTQYVQVARRIRTHLTETFGRRFPFLHGGLSPAAREAEIAAFNADREPNAFLVSLRAGGFGLNLTRATHVVHFDRWWNPAVENQATDRAHRIGQTRTVFVHLFICAGTLEDRIDALLEEKRRLAGDVVVSGEAFLAQMSAREFERTVALA